MTAVKEHIFNSWTKTSQQNGKIKARFLVILLPLSSPRVRRVERETFSKERSRFSILG
jgi:hypothetical protein